MSTSIFTETLRQALSKKSLQQLKPKLPNKNFNYCKDFLDKPYRSVWVNIEVDIQNILKNRDLIFTNQNAAIQDKKEFNLEESFSNLKAQIRKDIELWFKVFNTELAYEKAKKEPNMLLYSHRMSGWLNYEFNGTYKLVEVPQWQIKFYETSSFA